MADMFERTSLLLGSDGIGRLKKAKVALFGVGGVGGFAAEALARAGVGAVDLFDKDTVSESNLNRQLAALRSTVGAYKTDVLKQRMLDINKDIKINSFKVFYLPDNAGDFPLDGYDYVIDAVDTVSAKLELICRCKADNIPVISAMGAGNKLDPTAFRVGDIFETSVCPLARVMRRELKKRGVKSLKVVYSEEKPVVPAGVAFDESSAKPVPGSVSFVPPVMGMIIAGEVIKDIAGVNI